MRGHVRPSPCPIALLARDEPRADLLAFKRHFCDRPLDASQIRCSVHLGSDDHNAKVILGYGARTLGVPIIGEWPLDDLSPDGLVQMVREIVDGMVKDHGDVVTAHASTAVAICGIMGTMPEYDHAAKDGSFHVEVCLEDDATPIFWIENEKPGEADHRLPVDLAILEGFAGPMRIPCHMYGIEQAGRSFDTIGFSMSDQEGIEITAPPLDAIGMLRLHRHVETALEDAAAAALGEEA